MNKYSKILLPTFYIGIIAVMVLCSTLVVSGVKTYLLNRQEMKFTIDNVFDEDTTPVVKTETNIIVKPYISDSVKVGRYFYDFESDEKKQENSLILYEDTYMQNNGVDYVDNKNFDVVPILCRKSNELTLTTAPSIPKSKSPRFKEISSITLIISLLSLQTE